jgi:hypothetical protein
MGCQVLLLVFNPVTTIKTSTATVGMTKDGAKVQFEWDKLKLEKWIYGERVHGVLCF